MKYLLSYMSMFIAMIVTLILGGGFFTVIAFSMLTLIFSTFFWEQWLKTIKKTERRANA
ncbi:hypothetical protein LZT85_04595 [Staphylococcus epidermidis]|uniref:hypothetical protein n=1 Tax=Staphylococcus epidermidis TaxID=1282 RepID=UPI00164344DE|nr:hypothetical protein [Staphylococcus epidermidis]MBC3075871.1 hypothetical protein [Staphylococcus epidermidis]MBM6047686.1 hypothetical protein [Staphylococcus epidermidis]MCO6226729.1 hypothetical protein [Staphylococcus epidermidis]MCO6232451.1 hypothetical protein [Staphylococcus epidermidis]